MNASSGRSWIRLASLLVFLAAVFRPTCAGAGGLAAPLFVSTEHRVYVFDRSTGALVQTIDPPNLGYIAGIAAGPRGSIFISVFNYPQDFTVIYEYDRGAVRPSFRYPAGPYEGPIAVSDTGQIAFLAGCAYGGCGQESLDVVFYAYHREQSIGHIRVPIGIAHLAYGPGGTLWDAYDVPYDVVAYLAPGASKFASVRLETRLGVRALPIDEHGDILAFSPESTIIVFGGRSGRLFSRIPIGGISEKFVGMALSEDDGRLFVATDRHVYAYDYPAGGMPIARFDIGRIAQIAVGRN